VRAALLYISEDVFAGRLLIGVAGAKHSGEAGHFFFAAAPFARLFEAAAIAHFFERAFAVDFFLQPAEGLICWFAFF
jgi:hypothetical protein